MADSQMVDTGAGDRFAAERADLLETLGRHRFFVTVTVRGLDPQQLRARSTVSELTLGGLLQHLAAMERQWTGFMHEGPRAFASWTGGELTPEQIAVWQQQWQVPEGATAESLLEDYAAAGAATDEAVRTLDLDTRHPLPPASWFPRGASWSVRRAALHLIAETSQHAGHADIIREAIDGQKTMG